MLKFLNNYFQSIFKIRGQSNKFGVEVTKQAGSHFQLLKFNFNMFFLIGIVKYIFEIVL